MYQRNNNQMQTPSPNTSFNVQFQGKMLNVYEPTIGKISLYFDDVNEGIRHEVVQHKLQKVNYKTFEAGIKKNYPNIISCRLTNVENTFYLTVEVAYEFLPKMEQTLVFNKRKLTIQQTQEASIQILHSTLNHIRQNAIALSNAIVVSGQVEYDGCGFQIYSTIPHDFVVYTWAVHFSKCPSSKVKARMSYCDSATRQIQKTDLMPQDGISVTATGKTAFMELHFFVEKKQFNSVIFALQGKYQGQYSLIAEKVTKE